MPFIDQRGRFFGRLNLIDLLCAVLAGALLLSFGFAYSHLHGQIPIQSQMVLNALEYHWLDFSVTLKAIPHDILPLIHVGDLEVLEPGGPIAKILSLGSSEPDTIEIPWGSAPELIRIQSARHVRLPAVVRLRCGVREDRLYFNSRILTQNTRINLDMPKYSVQGIVELPMPAIPAKGVDGAK